MDIAKNREKINKSVANVMITLNLACAGGIFKKLDEAAQISMDVKDIITYIVDLEKRIEDLQDVVSNTPKMA